MPVAKFTRFLTAALVVFCAAGLAVAQSIRTVAGGGSEDGQLATSLNVYGPRGIAIDRAGNILFAERFGGRVYRVDSAGKVATVAGNGASGFSGDGGAATNATLKQPRGLAIDADGTIYIADAENGRIRKVDPKSGVITTVAGIGGAFPPDSGIGDGGPATKAFLSVPWGLALDRGFLYATESGYLGNRVRKVNLATGVIDTIAGALDGTNAYGGDNGPARSALLDQPEGIAIDAAGNIFVADSNNNRVRRIDAVSGNIATYAGGGMAPDDGGDGQLANAVSLTYPTVLAFDPNGNLVVAGGARPRLRKIDRSTQIITTVLADIGLIYGMTIDPRGTIYYSDDGYNRVLRLRLEDTEGVVFAGGGSYVGDGLVANAGILHEPLGLALSSRGDVYIAAAADQLVRKVDASTGAITTVAGRVGAFYADNQEGIDATQAAIGGPLDIALDSAGLLYIGEPHNNRVWRVDAAGKITTYGGGGPEGVVGDNGPATGASLYPEGLAFDRNDNLFIADHGSNRVRRVDAKTKIITTVAGNGTDGFAGDGGPATAAMLSTPSGVTVDDAGNVYVADAGNSAVRKIDAQTGNISTIAGRGDPNMGLGDGGPATGITLNASRVVFDRRSGALYVTDRGTHRVGRIDVKTNIITTLAGSATDNFDGDFTGDNGPATSARLNFGYDLSGLAISAAGDVYISDSDNNRVRLVAACVTVAAPRLSSPTDGASGTSTAPVLSWSAVEHAFRYDVFLDTVSPPQRVFASDVSETSVAPANLQPATKYYWSVAAKGDSFCSPQSKASSPVASFTTGGTCAAGAFDTIAPAEGSFASLTPVLTWQPSSGAASYDVYLGPVKPPPLAASGIQDTKYAATVGVGTHYWFVLAHAACDSTETASTAIRSFDTLGSLNCNTPTVVTLSQPPNGAAGVATTLDLTWSSNNFVTTYDLYFGTVPGPPLLDMNLVNPRQTVTTLAPGTTYYWRVVAHSPCDTSPVSSAVASFTTRSCAAPGATSIVFYPASVSSGATYSIVWSVASGLDADGGYLVERSLSPAFSPVLDAQIASSAAASFVAGAAGTYYHRVRAVPGCDPSKSGQPSDVKSVVVTTARPNVIFTAHPSAVITSLGERLEDRRGSFTLENIGADSLQVIVGHSELNAVAPFFSIVDPQGKDAAFVTLDPRTPRTFEMRYSGPANDVAASYQGVIFVASTGQGLTVTPYAFVNLKIGGSATAVAPQFVTGGAPTDYVEFSGYPGDDANRPPLQVAIRNPGTTPMELAAEIGPEVWLVPEASWNATPIAPGASRTINLSTRRSRAPNGSPLPRYTYFTVRTRDGASSRLLVQDNDLAVTASGRSTRLDLDGRSFIVPEAVSRTTAGGNPLVTRLRLSNVGSDSVQVELIFTPAGSDGFEATNVKRSTVVVPPNDVVTLTDPLAQIFAVTPPADGQIEVRIPRERLGLIGVTSSLLVLGGRGGFALPTVNRGEGARSGAPHVLLGVTGSATLTTALMLSETSGVDKATVHATLFDANGTKIGETSSDVPRYGHVHIANAVTALGGTAIDNGRIDLRIDAGGGSVIGVATLTPAGSDGGATFVSRPVTETVAGSALARAFFRAKPSDTPVSLTIVVPVLGPPSSSGALPSYKTSVAFAAPASIAATFSAIFRSSGGALASPVATINVPAGTTRQFSDVVGGLFALPATSQGSVFVQGSSGGKVYAVLQSSAGAGASAVPAGVLPLPSSASEALTSVSGLARRPLFFDGLEQSVDPTRGSRWMVILNEVGGASGTVNVRLYEAGNRSVPIAEKELAIVSYQQLQLDTIFASLGLDTTERRKDRTNVQCVVTATAGNARVAASAVSIDNGSGDTRVFQLIPVTGSATPSISIVTPVVNQPPASPPRRRAARH